RRDVVAMEWIVGVIGAGQGVLGVHVLVVEVVAHQAMESILAGLRGHGELDRARVPILHGKGVDLVGRFLDDVGIWSEVQDTLPDGAGYVQAVHDPHVRDPALAVGAGIHFRFRREVVDTRSRRASPRRSLPGNTRRY